MYTREESARLRQAFWTAFGQYMALTPGAGGEKVNWLNYKTGVRHLQFKAETERDGAAVAIVLSHPDMQEQQTYYELLLQSKKMLEAQAGEDPSTNSGQVWQWQPPAPGEQGKITSRVYCRLAGVNVFNQAHWPAIISFLKPRLMALDTWWQEARWAFE